jgi:hypothetical protein
MTHGITSGVRSYHRRAIVRPAASNAEPDPERVAALSDLDPVWIRRTRIAFMFNGADADHDDFPDWLDPDTIMTAHVPGRREAVAASCSCEASRMTRASLDPRHRRRLAPVICA